MFVVSDLTKVNPATGVFPREQDDQPVRTDGQRREEEDYAQVVYTMPLILV